MRISVIIASLNRSRYIRAAIDSVLADGGEDVECVVVDGCSTDGTLEILAEAKASYGDALQFVSEKDSGPADAYNKGMRMASGDVLGCLGADDLISVGALAFLAEYFAEYPGHTVVYGECEIIEDSGNPIGRYAVKEFSLETQLDEGCCVQFPSCYFRKDVFDTVGSCEIGNLYSDLDWLVRAANSYTFNRVDRVLSRFRFHKGGLTGSTWDKELPAELFRLNRKYGGRFWSNVGKRYLLNRLRGFPLVSQILNCRLKKMDWRASKEEGRYFVFGAALTGWACQKALRETKREVIGFLDNFPPPNREYCGYEVRVPEDLLRDKGCADAVDGIVIATGGYPFAMRRQLRRMGWRGPVYRFSND